MEAPDHKDSTDFPEGWRANVFSLEAWRRHGIWLVAALLAGLAALYFRFVEAWADAFWQLFPETDHATWLLRSLALIGGMIFICRLRDRYFPGTEGTGIPQAIAALKTPEGPLRGKMLSLRIAIGKLLLLTFGILMGATIGREGPSVHVGACCMYLITKLRQYPAYLVQRGLILAGGAAGIAAAFNAPIAGAIFAFEEIGRSFEKNNAGTIIRTVIIACLVGFIPAGTYLFYGEVHASVHSWKLWVLVVVVGVVGGLLGGLFALGVARATPRIGRSMRQRPYVTAGALGLGLAVLGLLSDGLSYGSGYHQATDVLIHGRDLPWHYPLTKGAGNFISLISGIPGGLFDPSLAVGAGLGQLTVPLAETLDASANRQVVILVFMVAYFTGVVQSPITAAVIVLEMTAARFLTVPLLVTAIIAYEMSHLVCRTSLYEALAENFLKALGIQPVASASVGAASEQPASNSSPPA